LILPDVNVLVYAFRPDSPEHPRYRTWLEDVVNGTAAYGIAPQVLASVVRICTHPRIFSQPDPARDVFVFARVLLEHPNATVVVPAERHWSIFESLCDQSRATGPGCVVRRARHRVRLRVDHDRSRLRTVSRSDVASAL
jgi:predicted nucleic acid-binding protein